MAFDCTPGEIIEVSDLIEYIETNAVPGPVGPSGPQGPKGEEGIGVSDAYLLDGSQEIIAPFACGNQIFKNASSAIDDRDLTTLKQVEDKFVIGTYVPLPIR